MGLIVLNWYPGIRETGWKKDFIYISFNFGIWIDATIYRGCLSMHYPGMYYLTKKLELLSFGKVHDSCNMIDFKNLYEREYAICHVAEK